MTMDPASGRPITAPCLVVSVVLMCVVHIGLFLSHSSAQVSDSPMSASPPVLGFDGGSAKGYAFLAELGHSRAAQQPTRSHAVPRADALPVAPAPPQPLRLPDLGHQELPSVPLPIPVAAWQAPAATQTPALSSPPPPPASATASSRAASELGAAVTAPAPAPVPRPAPKRQSRKRSVRSGRSSRGSGASSKFPNGGVTTAMTKYAQSQGVTVLRSDANTIGRAYDFGCSESAKHSCACQMMCDKSGACKNAVNLCAKHPECKYMVMNMQGDWATLKRGPTAHELELLKVEDRNMTWPQLEALARTLPLPANAPNLRAAGFDDVAAAILEDAKGTPETRLCGRRPSSAGGGAVGMMERILQNKLGIVALEYQTPATFQNSAKSWRESGLLDLASEKIALINDPMPVETAIALKHGFQVVEPRQLPKPVAFNQPNVVTIGVAFYHTLRLAKADYVLFLEKDFKMDPEVGLQELKEQLLGSIWMLERGVPIIRLRSRKEMGCGTFRECKNDANKPDWNADTTKKRRRNWWSFFCEEGGKASARKAGVEIGTRVQECMRRPKLRCFTSWDSNWTLNAVLVDRRAMLERKFKYSKYGPQKGEVFGTLADFGNKQSKRQDGFEVGLLESADWGDLKVPLCLSYDGIFLHEEVDG